MATTFVNRHTSNMATVAFKHHQVGLVYYQLQLQTSYVQFERLEVCIHTGQLSLVCRIATTLSLYYLLFTSSKPSSSMIFSSLGSTYIFYDLRKLLGTC